MIWFLVGAAAVAMIVLALYMALAFYHRAVIAWREEREVEFTQVFQAARVILGRQHQYEWATDQDQQLVYRGTLLNYTTLAQMVMTEQDQRKLLEVAMDHVALFELEHPLPRPPRILTLTRLAD